MTSPFVYSEAPLVRQHAPRGYADYPSFLPWVRDDFGFRCVYCLHRERWVTGGFHLDHFLPVVQRPDLLTQYDNLLKLLFQQVASAHPRCLKQLICRYAFPTTAGRFAAGRGRLRAVATPERSGGTNCGDFS